MLQGFSLVLCCMLAHSCKTVAQLCQLNARYDESSQGVILDWNMIPHTAKTTFVLLRSTDANTWAAIVTEQVFQHYTKQDLFDYEDKVNGGQKYFYRLKIISVNHTTIAISNTVAVSAGAGKSSWVIYPNPVNDVLHLVYEGSIVKGVINVTVQDVAGKIVKRFRAASVYRRLEIPVSTLPRGVYLVQISIMNETVMSRKIIKQ